ncbi:MAG: WD40 repeat domain-containing protein [Chloroflexota bacterium]
MNARKGRIVKVSTLRRRVDGQPAVHSNIVWDLSFSQDGQILATGSADGTAFLWDVDLQSLTEQACQHAGRNMTPEEWEHYFGDEPYRATCPTLNDG